MCPSPLHRISLSCLVLWGQLHVFSVLPWVEVILALDFSVNSIAIQLHHYHLEAYLLICIPYSLHGIVAIAQWGEVVSPQKMIFSQKGSHNQYRFLYFCERIEYWYSGQIECFWKSFLNHFLNVFASMHLVNVLITPFLHVFLLSVLWELCSELCC